MVESCVGHLTQILILIIIIMGFHSFVTDKAKVKRKKSTTSVH